MSGNPPDGCFDAAPHPANPVALSQRDIVLIDGEARMQDLRIAEALGFERPRDVRKLIQRNIERLRQHGLVCATASQTKSVRGRAEGRPSKAYYLNQRQAYRLCMWSDAPNANAVQEQMIEVFIAWQEGRLTPANGGSQNPASSREVTVADFDHDALAKIGSVVKNVVRKRDTEMIGGIEAAIDQMIFSSVRNGLPRLEKYVEQIVEETLQDFVMNQAAPLAEKLATIVAKRLNEPLVLEPMATYRTPQPQARPEREPPVLPRMDLRLFRKMRGWSCQVVAEKIGTTASAVSKHEQGRSIPSPRLMDGYHRISGGRLTADPFFEAYRARRKKLGIWPIKGQPANMEGEQ